MPGFAMSPAQGFNPQTPDEFPDFIQFRDQGADLGGPDADVLDFGAGLQATRGTGENANVVSVVATGGSGGAATLMLSLQANTQAAFDGVVFNDWDATQEVASADAEWSAGAIAFNRTGMYEVTIIGRVSTEGGPWGTLGETYYGSEITNARGLTKSGHSRKAESDSLFVGPPSVVWTDKYFVNITDIETQTVTPSLHADRYVDENDPADMRAMVSVTRIGAPFIEA